MLWDASLPLTTSSWELLNLRSNCNKLSLSRLRCAKKAAPRETCLKPELLKNALFHASLDDNYGQWWKDWLICNTTFIINGSMSLDLIQSISYFSLHARYFVHAILLKLVYMPICILIYDWVYVYKPNMFVSKIPHGLMNQIKPSLQKVYWLYIYNWFSFRVTSNQYDL